MESTSENDKVKMFTCLQEHMNISMRDVDKKAFEELKAKARKKGLKTGAAATQAFILWNDKDNEKKTKKSFFDLKPWRFGKHTAKDSERIDELLYGGEL